MHAGLLLSTHSRHFKNFSSLGTGLANVRMRNVKETRVPRARKDQLIVKEVRGDVLVYDLKTYKAHCLNDTAARVWRSCDGRRTVAEIAQRLERDLKSPVDCRVVWLALDQLDKFNLLKSSTPKPIGMPQISRRTLIRSGLAAAVLLPLIVTISAPTALAAGSPITKATCQSRLQSGADGGGGNPCSDVPGQTCQAAS